MAKLEPQEVNQHINVLKKKNHLITLPEAEKSFDKFNNLSKKRFSQNRVSIMLDDEISSSLLFKSRIKQLYSNHLLY